MINITFLYVFNRALLEPVVRRVGLETREIEA